MVGFVETNKLHDRTCANFALMRNKKIPNEKLIRNARNMANNPSNLNEKSSESPQTSKLPRR